MPLRLPALTDHRRVLFGALIALYVGQGIPLGLLVVALPAYLVERGAGSVEVGSYLAAVLLPFALKVIVGPIIDRYTFPAMGRRRPWVLVGGIGVVASFVSMALIQDAASSLALLTVAGVAVTTSVAVLNVAVDGMAVDVLEVEEQSRANALMWGGATIGVAVSAVVTARLLEGGIGVAAGGVAVVQALLLAVPLLLRERPGERLLPWTPGQASRTTQERQPESWGMVIRRLRDAVALPASLALLAAAWCAGALDGLLLAFMPTLAVGELGWTDTGYADVVAFGQVGAGLLGMALGSVLIERIGRVRMLTGLAVLVAVVLLVMASIPSLWATKAVVVAFAAGYLVTFVLLTITLFATGMALCGPAVAATQFALFTTAINVGRSSGSGMLGGLDSVMSASAIFATVAGLAVVVALLASRLDLEGHRARLGLEVAKA